MARNPCDVIPSGGDSIIVNSDHPLSIATKASSSRPKQARLCDPSFISREPNPAKLLKDPIHESRADYSLSGVPLGSTGRLCATSVMIG